MSLLDEIYGVRSVLGNPLENAPSADDIEEALEEVYQYVTNRTNNTGNAQQIGTLNIQAVEGTYVYQIETPLDDFYKALSVVTVPENTSDPEYSLEFVEVEHIPQEWQWITASGGRLYSSSHSGQYIAFYRKMGLDGETVWCEIRPVPSRDETYKITYQIGSWWDRITSTDYGMPQKEQRFHLRRLAASMLFHKTRWSYDSAANAIKKTEVKEILDRAIEMGTRAFEDHLSSLDNADVVEIEAYPDYWAV